MKQVVTRMPESLHAAVMARAKTEGLSFGEIVRMATVKWLDSNWMGSSSKRALKALSDAAGRIKPCSAHKPLRSPLCRLCQLHARMEEADAALAAAKGGKA